MDLHHSSYGRFLFINASIHGSQFYLRVYIHDDQRSFNRNNCNFFKNIDKNGPWKASLCWLWNGYFRNPYCWIIILYGVKSKRIINFRNFLNKFRTNNLLVTFSCWSHWFSMDFSTLMNNFCWKSILSIPCRWLVMKVFLAWFWSPLSQQSWVSFLVILGKKLVSLILKINHSLNFHSCFSNNCSITLSF